MRNRSSRLPKLGLRARMLLIFVGGLFTAQVLYLVIDDAISSRLFDRKMIARAVEKYVLQADAVRRDPKVTLPAETASPVTQRSRVWIAGTSALADLPLERDSTLADRVRAALKQQGMTAGSIEAGYGVLPRTPEQIERRRRAFGRWALPKDAVIAVQLDGIGGWLNAQIGSQPPPPPVSAQDLLLNLLIF
ncbi:MAG: hypothetical protein AAF637_25135, partial [Pseudomonadota bacterium]